MSLSRLSLPSIHHVLEENLHEILPPRPSVITVLEYDQQDHSPPTSTSTSTLPVLDIGYIPSTSHLMKTIDLRNTEPLSKDDEEQFSFIVHFPDEIALDSDADADARTIFKEKRPSTSRGFRHDSERVLVSSTTQDSAKHDHSPLIITSVRKLLPVKLAQALLRIRRTNRQ